MIIDAPRREDSRLDWNDIELLPLYGGALLLAALLLHSVADIGGITGAQSVKAMLVCALVALNGWLGADDGASA